MGGVRVCSSLAVPFLSLGIGVGALFHVNNQWNIRLGDGGRPGGRGRAWEGGERERIEVGGGAGGSKRK